MGTVRFDGRSFNVVDDHYSGYWQSLSDGAWEPETTLAISRTVGPDWQYYDIGAWMGPTALLAAAAGAEVHAFEPDPVAFKRLHANRLLNPGLRLTLNNAAAGTREGTMQLYADALGNSETSVFAKRERAAGVQTADVLIDVPMIDMAAYFVRTARADAPQFIKMDIEGGEFELLPALMPALRNHQFALHLSTHTFNIVLPSAAAQTEQRGAAKRSIFDLLHDLKWYGYGAAGIVQVDGRDVSADRLSRPDAADEIFVANFDLLRG